MFGNPGEKKALAIIAIVAVLFVVVVGASVAALTVNVKHSDEPYLQISQGDRLVKVTPRTWCDVGLTSCDPPLDKPRPVTAFPLKVNDTALVSLSHGVATAPWWLTTEYLTPTGQVVVEQQKVLGGNTYTLTLRSTPERTLLTLEIGVFSAVQTADGQVAARGYFGVDTTPEGLKLPT